MGKLRTCTLCGYPRPNVETYDDSHIRNTLRAVKETSSVEKENDILKQENSSLKELVGRILTNVNIVHDDVMLEIGFIEAITEAKHALQNGSVSDINNGVEYTEGE